MTTATKYATFNGVPLWDVNQTAAYADGKAGPVSISDISCQGLIDAVTARTGVAPVYTDPATDGAWWFDPTIPATLNFYGFVPYAVDGVDASTFTRSASRLAGGGSSFTRGIYASRSIRVRGLLAGATCCATQAGFDALTHILISPECDPAGGCDRGGCRGHDLLIPKCLPDANCQTDGAAEVAEWQTAKNVRLLRPPTITQRFGDGGCGCGGCSAVEIEFFLESGEGGLWGDSQDLGTVTVDTTGVPVGFLWEDCTDNDNQLLCDTVDTDCVLDPNVTVLEVPQAPQTSTLTGALESYQAGLTLNTAAVGGALSFMSIGTEITVGATPIRNLRIEYVPNPAGEDCTDPTASPFLNADCLSCSVQVVGYAPANSTIIIDPTTQTVTTVCDTGVSAPTPMTANSFPTFECDDTVCVIVNADADETFDDVTVSFVGYVRR